jgi:hypothetical protein
VLQKGKPGKDQESAALKWIDTLNQVRALPIGWCPAVHKVYEHGPPRHQSINGLTQPPNITFNSEGQLKLIDFD